MGFKRFIYRSFKKVLKVYADISRFVFQSVVMNEAMHVKIVVLPQPERVVCRMMLRSARARVLHAFVWVSQAYHAIQSRAVAELACVGRRNGPCLPFIKTSGSQKKESYDQEPTSESDSSAKPFVEFCAKHQPTPKNVRIADSRSPVGATSEDRTTTVVVPAIFMMGGLALVACNENVVFIRRSAYLTTK